MVGQLLEKIHIAEQLQEANESHSDRTKEELDLIALASGDLFSVRKILERLATGRYVADESVLAELNRMVDDLLPILKLNCEIDAESAISLSQRFGNVTQSLIDSFRTE